MKKIFLILTDTGTILSKIVKFYTKKKYAHVSIALDINLHQMYSFGRLNPYNAFIGGFVHENKKFGTFKRFKNTRAIISYIEIEDSQYLKLKELISHFKNNKKNYKFNTIGLALVPFQISFKRKNAFYCAEFVQYMLDKSGISNQLPTLIKPLDFLEINNLKILYEGKLANYKGSQILV